jgi:crotonobetainyl-CoA:carnitine CoA-transferase CaiB-like acyl-CoA transferase
MNSSILSELRVIELASVLAGPAVGMFFAELGADVIKVEPPAGDVTRGWKVAGEDPHASLSGYFSSVNYRKAYQRLDLKQQMDRQTVYDLVAEADVVITNYKSEDTARKLGMDAPTLHRINEQLIYAHLAGFESIPDRTAYDVVVQAETGFMSMNGTPESGPLKMPLAMMDILAAHQLKEGILLALLERAKTGSGRVVEASLERAGLASLYNQATNQLMAGHTPGLMGSRHPNIAPYGDMFRTADGKLMVTAIGDDRQFERFCRLLEIDLAEQPEFATNQLRLKHREALCEALQVAIAQHDREELIGQCIKQDIPVGAVRSLDEVLRQPMAQSMIREERIEDHPTRRLTTLGFELRDPT